MNEVAGERVRALRRELGLTQQQIADRTGLARTVVNKIERSGSGLGMWAKRRALATGFGLDVVTLASYVDGEITLRQALAARNETAPKGTN